MAVMCANVALLLFARAATREAEIAVRSALGASRGRIVGQLFVEALVLAGAATAVGLVAAGAGLRWLHALNPPHLGAMPIWIGDTISAGTVAWALALGLAGAAMAGIAPALQATARASGPALQRAAGRGTAAGMGRLWRGIVVGQVALTVIFMPVVFVVGTFYWTVRAAASPVAAEEYVVARVEAGQAEAFAEAVAALSARIAAEPDVLAVAAADWVWPGWYGNRALEVEDLPAPPGPVSRRRSQHMAVDPHFFDALGARLLEGRALSEADAGAAVIVVDEAFVRHVLDGRNAVGRRIRIAGLPRSAELSPTAETAAAAGEWHDIVGVVSELALNPHADLPHAGVIYHPLAADGAAALTLIVRTAGDRDALATRLRLLALDAGAGLVMQQPLPLDYVRGQPVREYAAWFRVAAGAGGIGLLLTLTGIYAVMAYTVARRRREIGVRIALGAVPRQVTAAVLVRAVKLVGAGVLAGATVIPVAVFALSRAVDPPPQLPPFFEAAGILIAYMTLMMLVCLLACVVPVRRALRIQPVEALGGEG
jgi:putative ABC transport system permease protein